jgi:HD-GYP domain-containing protein (c-di-GMP phosphodiesterase class II)
MRAAVVLSTDGGGTFKGTIISAPEDRLIITLDKNGDSVEDLAVGTEMTISATADGTAYEAECNVLEVEQLGSTRFATSGPIAARRRIELATALWTTLLDDCAIYAAERSDPGNWDTYPVVARLLSVSAAMVESRQEITTGSEGSEYMHVVEFGLPWGFGTVMLRTRVSDEGKADQGRETVWKYRLSFIEPTQTAKETITNYVNRSQLEMRLRGNPGPKGPDGGREAPGPTAVLAAVEVVKRPAEAIDLESFMSDLSRPTIEWAQRLDGDAAKIAREIMTPPKPQNIRQATPIVRDMIDYMEANPDMLESLVKGLSTDSDLYVHPVKVSVYTVAMARRMGITDQDQPENLAIGGFLHDIGKSAVRAEILTKPGPLNTSEWVVIRRHPYTGRALVSEAGDFGSIVFDCIVHHAERVDGSGYPDGLLGPDIPEVARIVAVADAFDALTVDKPWRARHGLFEALLIMRDEMARSFDRAVLKVMI